jgi:hypothetical protein
MSLLRVHNNNNNRPENDEVKDYHPSFPNHDHEEQLASCSSNRFIKQPWQQQARE